MVKQKEFRAIESIGEIKHWQCYPFEGIIEYKKSHKELNHSLIITPDGQIYYSYDTPAGFAEKYIQSEFDCPDALLWELCPPQYRDDYALWLMKVSGLVVVTTNTCLYDRASVPQLAQVRQLKMAGLYKGQLPLRTNKKRTFNN